MNKRWWVALVVGFGVLKLLGFLFLSKYLLGQFGSTPDPMAVDWDSAGFPRFIPQTRIRRADKGGGAVSLGRLQLVGGLSPFTLGRSFVNLSTPYIEVLGAIRNSSLKRDFRWRKLSPQYSYAEFNRLLQCSEHEPDLDGLRGTLSLAKLAPVTRDTVRIVAAFVESDGTCSPWVQCRRLANYLEERFRNSSMGPIAATPVGDQSLFAKVWKRVANAPIDDRTRLIRIVGGVIYTDWPWGAWRFDKLEPDYFALRLLGAVAELTPLPDCVFFLRNYDYPLLPAFVPMPAFSHSPSNLHADIPLPWVRAVDEEIAWFQDQLFGNGNSKKIMYNNLYYDEGAATATLSKRRRLTSSSLSSSQLLTTSGSGITGTSINILSRIPINMATTVEAGSGAATHTPSHTHPPPDEARAREAFSLRRSKAAFYGYLWGTPSATARLVVLDLARQHPDLLEVQWSAAFDVRAWNPLSEEKDVFDSQGLLQVGKEFAQKNSSPPGFLRSYRGQKQRDRLSPREYVSGTKYLLVLSGNNGADRLGPFLAHSGAVIMLQENDALSHFSSRLKPWVHYVPVSHTAADVVDKIRWLQENDDMAYQLAKNAYLFGRSFLRLEDYYCYTARGVMAVAEVEAADSKLPFPQGLRPAFAQHY